MTNFAGLLITRLILGYALKLLFITLSPFIYYPFCVYTSIIESAYIPGVLYQLSRVYTRDELPLRVSCLVGTAFLSGVVSGFIGYGTSHLDGKAGLDAWRYLFIIEGAPGILLGIAAYFCLFNDIRKVSWLTDEQKQWQIQRMEKINIDDTHSITAKNVFLSLISWKTWAFAALMFLDAEIMLTTSTFSPTLIIGALPR